MGFYGLVRDRVTIIFSGLDGWEFVTTQYVLPATAVKEHCGEIEEAEHSLATAEQLSFLTANPITAFAGGDAEENCKIADPLLGVEIRKASVMPAELGIGQV